MDNDSIEEARCDRRSWDELTPELQHTALRIENVTGKDGKPARISQNGAFMVLDSSKESISISVVNSSEFVVEGFTVHCVSARWRYRLLCWLVEHLKGNSIDANNTRIYYETN